MDNNELFEPDGSEIAIIGMACRFPGANSPDAFWDNLRNGVESITFLSDAELLQAGVDPALLADPRYVKAAPLIDHIEDFDAGFFGYTALEAELIDPQQRVLLEVAWEALEHAGYNPETYEDAIGVYAGSKTNTYLFHLAANRELVRSIDFFQLVLGGDQAMLSTRVSYKFNLKGPSYAVQTACSTSLVAVHLACQSLLIDECRMALAGSVALNVPQTSGYLYQEGGILAPDGHCRAFDAQAQGTIFGSGAGMVVLKRLADALADGDTIYAVVKGTATNNDGSDKATFTAPSIDGQTDVILESLACAGVEADTISYVETHGTGTQIGDPIELLALTNAFRAGTERVQFCAIGSVKSNLGHLDAAAGMSSLIKTVLALKHRQIPPSLHFETPNPKIDFTNSPFFVNTTLRDWEAESPRRAGVSSFGFGGTNAHVILEEAPPQAPSDPAQPWQLLVLSTKTPTALDQTTANLADYLQQNPEAALADVAYTLQVGRQAFSHRRVLACRDRADALEALQAKDPARLITGAPELNNRPVVFMFSGQGAQYVGMGRDLYDHEPVFREHVDRCCELLTPHLGRDLREVLYPEDREPRTENREPRTENREPRTDEEGERGRRGARETGSEGDAPRTTQDDGRRTTDHGPRTTDDNRLEQTQYTQPALFVIEYALAQLWMSWGIQPQALIGHSIGEYVAACLAGVFSLKDALTLVAARGRMMQNLPAGAMLSIPLPEADVRPLLGADLDLAAVNAPTSCVVSGAEHAIGALLQRLDAQGIQSRRLQTSHAFHSTMMEPILEPFAQLVAAARPQAPQIPFISNVSGAWITEAEATDARYWARHLRQPVRFADGVNTLMEAPARVLLEVGPGTTLSVFARQNAGQPAAFSTLPHPNDRRSALEVALTALGRLWLAGVRMNWPLLHASARRRRIPLPTYPFERQRHWLLEAPIHVSERSFASNKKADVSQWLYTPVWQRQALPSPEASSTADQAQRWLIFSDPYGIGDGLTEHLRERGRRVIRVLPGERFARCDDDRYTLDPHQADQYAALLDELSAQSSAPQRIVHCWSLDAARATEVQLDAFEQAQDLGYYSLLFLAQALGKQLPGGAVELTVVTNDTRRVTGAEILRPERATVGGPCLVIPQEHPTIICRQIDIDTPAPDGPTNADVIQQLTSEVFATPLDVAVAYRGAERWVQSFEAIESTAVAETQPPAKLRERGVYLITGGLGGIGLALANYLTRAARARLVLLGRTALPERAEWDGWLAAHTPDDPISARIRAVQALEAQGTEVLVVSADVADADEMRAAVRLAEQRFGAIHGVIHSAGTARGSWFKAIGETGRAESDRHFQPKVYGLLGLTQALRGRSLDFCILQSSLASVLGGLGNVAYAAANQFLDVYAQQQPDGTPWISINWDSWHNQDDQEHGIGATLVNLAITPDEGAQAFQQILALPDTPQVIVSTADLHARVAQWVRLEHLRVAQSPGASALSRTNGSLAGRLELESAITEIWQRVLGAPHVGLHDNFFDLGGNSLSGMQLIAELKRVLDVQLAPVALFEAPTVSALARLIQPNADAELERTTSPMRADTTEDAAIAIIGMAGRFPGAETLDLFWQNLRAGVESITFFSDDELRASGIPPALLRDPAYVKARPILDDVAGFDAAFFGYAPREAELMDPQHRLFLECAWHALEDAGYATDDQRESIGIFGGASISTYLLNLCMTTDLVASVDPLQTVIGNDKDSLTTSVSYKLNLTGPSMAVQTFCSTSLVAVHLACQSLQRGECSMALAGGVSIVVPQQSGYHYQPDGIVSPDGHCRSFDAQAQGTLFGNGVGLVLLKPLAAAQRDGDHIYAVLKGSAINNDGALKVGYTAPSVDGQAAVIRAAQQAAGVAPDTITYLETHGTGTALGDPIEVAALTKAFRAQTDQTGFCALGALKPNVGHLDRAAGVAALIKAVLALRQQEIPPVAHFTAPNPACDLANSPFYVPTAPTPWAAGATPRRAGVSALGFGGTNAHVIVEEAPAQDASGPGRPWLLLPLAAKSAAALAQASANLATYLAQHPETPLADVAYTLQVGRRAFQHRRILVCRDHADAIEALRSGDPRRVFNDTQESRERPIAFMFSGQGSQHVGMGGQLYDHETVFREHIDRCCELLLPHLGRDLRTLLYPDADQADVAADELRQTALTQPALFVIEYALAQLWMSWGIRPHALIGHSVGEYVAACLAGVFTLEDALALVAARGRLMQNLPTGAMLSVPLPENELRRILGETAHAEGSNGASAPAVFVSDHATMQAHIPLLPAAIAQQLALAAINTPSQSVVAGPEEAIVALEQHLARGQVDTRRLQTSHAFHSAMMDPILEPFAQLIAAARPQAPQIPLISNVSGDWMTDAEATDPHYWARHLRQPVRFAAGVATLLLAPDRALLEVGPGQTLTTLARRHPARSPRQSVIASMRHPREHTDDLAFLLTALGRLWLSGATIDWTHFTAHERRQRVPLPHYPFDHQRYWIDSDPAALASNSRRTSEGKRADIGDWFYLPSWKRTITPKPQPTASTIEPRAWLLFVDESGVGEALAQRLTQSDQDVTIVRPGAGFTQIDERRYTIDPGRSADYDALMAALQRQERLPHTIAHLWSIAERTATAQTRQAFEQAQQYGFYSMLFLTQALAKTAPTHAAQLVVITNQLHSVTAEESAQPEKAPILGLCAVIPQEYPHLSCRAIDLSAPRHRFGRAVDQLLAECLAPAAERVVAYRGAQRWVQTFEPMRLEADDATVRDLREQGIYLITDGLDGIGLGIAAYLARTVKAKLALIERDELPPREEWAALAAQPEGQSAISDKIRRALALEAHGAEVLTLHADTTDAEQLRHAIDAAITRFGALHGVIHAAGVIGERLFRAIQETTPAECAWHFAPKIYSLFALEQALDDREIDFCLLVSSLACFLGGRGYTAYAASDLFMDSFAQNHNKHHPTPWISVNWDAWQFEGARLTSITADLAQFAMSQDEGGEAFRRIVTMNTADQVAVSTGDLVSRLATWARKIDTLRDQLNPESEAATPRHPRPTLQTPYVAPQTEIERAIADIWQRALGFEQVGVHDNFFDLGGDSFIAIRVVARLKETFDKDISAVSLYEGPTISALSKLVTQDETLEAAPEEQEAKLTRRKQYRHMKRSRRELQGDMLND